MINFIKDILNRRKAKIAARNELCDNTIAQFKSANEAADRLFCDAHVLIDTDEYTKWKETYSKALQETRSDEIKNLKKAEHFSGLINEHTKLTENKKHLEQRILFHNRKVTNEMIKNAYALIGNVEGRKLDRQQMECIVKDSHNHLVIAGAGTGKTTTVIGKIKFLLKSKQCAPEDILVLSFTNASASEMNERIRKETGYNIAASTFHKLGLNIISAVDAAFPKITQLRLKKFIKEQILTEMKSESYLKLLNAYMVYNRISAKSEFDFKTKEEYEEYLKFNPPITLCGNEVKSYGEMDIANFLTQNGIQYIYEQPYKIDTRTEIYGQYHPDFYLPDYDIYIEYFGINRNGEVPPWFSAYGTTTASQHYLDSIEWKRNLHQSNGTKMIECFAYEKSEGTLLENLHRNLINFEVCITPKSEAEVWNQISQSEDDILEGVVELFETVINLIKSNRYSIEYVRKLNAERENTNNNNKIILLLIEPIYNAYNDYLAKNGEIDFNDMINTARQYVDEGKYINPYKYVIVDEYQDISKSRFLLLNSLRQSSDYELFCVGDDWQSIYRFAGSDISYIINFEHYWGRTEISKIETTYRFPKKLIDISSDFIMKNPMQIRKNIVSSNADAGFALGEVSGFNEQCAIEFVAKRINDLPQKSSVFFIGRYSFDAELLNKSGLFECRYDNQLGLIKIIYRPRPDLTLNFLTAHKSKGLQADYVFIINNKKSKMGFPSKIQDSPILDLLLDNCDQYPYAEERRLFYVALTRAKKKAFIVTVKGKESVFAMELKELYKDDLKREQYECPICGGKLRKISGQYGDFFGCSNYKVTGCTYKRKINSNTSQVDKVTYNVIK